MNVSFLFDILYSVFYEVLINHARYYLLSLIFINGYVVRIVSIFEESNHHLWR